MALIKWLIVGLGIGWLSSTIPAPSEPTIRWAPAQIDTLLAPVTYFPCINLVDREPLISGDTIQVVWTPYSPIACTTFVERSEYVPQFTDNE